MSNLSATFLRTYPPNPDAALVNKMADEIEQSVHPIFARRNWGCNLILRQLSDTEYVQLGPVLLLTTQYLMSGPALVFLHAFLYGPRENVKDLDGKDQMAFRRIYMSPADLPAAEADKVRRDLTDLASHVKIRFITTSKVATTFIDNRPRTGGHAHALIELTDKMLDQIRGTNPNNQGADLQLYISITFFLLHELAHALSRVRNNVSEEIFFEDSPMCELGYAFESWLLGGTLETADSIMTLIELPSRKVMVRQVTLPGQIAIPMRAGSRMPQEDVVWKVEEPWMEMLFMRDFWGVTIPTVGRAAMLPPKDKRTYVKLVGRFVGDVDEEL